MSPDLPIVCGECGAEGRHVKAFDPPVPSPKLWPLLALPCGALFSGATDEPIADCVAGIHDHELWRRFAYAVVVAGKNSKFAAGAVRRLFGDPGSASYNPRGMLANWMESGILDEALRACRAGAYRKNGAALAEAVTSGIDLRTVSPARLEQIPGVGPKTARFFCLWTRAGERCAAVDVHVARWLGEMSGSNTGFSTRGPPRSAGEYASMEAEFLAHADRLGLSARHLDALVWAEGSGRRYAVQAADV